MPLDPTTHGMISTPQLERMRSDAVNMTACKRLFSLGCGPHTDWRDQVLINTCRGPVVDEPALIEALRANLISGAVMDVSS